MIQSLFAFDMPAELFKKDKPRLTMVRAGLFLPHTKTEFLCFLAFLINSPIAAIC